MAGKGKKVEGYGMQGIQYLENEALKQSSAEWRDLRNGDMFGILLNA